MTAQAKTILKPYPDSAKSIEMPPTPQPKPQPSRTWIGAGIFSFICLFALGIGAWRLSSFLPTFSVPTEAPSLTVSESTAVANAPVLVIGIDLPAAEGMVEITGGDYEVGRSPADEYHSEPRTVTLNNFWIDQYQITNAHYQQYLTETGAPPPQVWPGEATHPVRGLTWEQALAYCQWTRKRLPSEAEWEASGRGPGPAPQLYPWGNDVSAEGQALRLPSQNTYPVGTQSFNQSPFGVFDMVGNIWEWVGEAYTGGQDGSRVLRGGRYGLPVLDLAYRLVVSPDDTRYIHYAGFRCAADQVK